MARETAVRCRWKSAFAAATLVVSVGSCMTSPRDGGVLPHMGSVVGLVAFAFPGMVYKFEYALFRKDGGSYVIDEWRPLGTCAGSTPIFTDVQGVQWQGCAIATQLPVTDCTNGGRGAWHGDPLNPGSPQRFAKVRTTVNNGQVQLFVYPSTVTDAQLQASYDSVGGLGTIGNYTSGNVAEIRVNRPTVGAASFPDGAPATDVVVLGDRAYVGRVEGAGPEFGIFEIGASGTPQLRKSVEIGAGVLAVAADGDYAYLATDDPSLVVVSIVDPDAAAVVAQIPLSGPEPASAIAAVGGSVVVGRKDRGIEPELEVWSATDSAHLADLVQRDTLEIGADVNSIDVTTGLLVPPATHVEKTIAYLATSHDPQKIWAVDLTDPNNIATHATHSIAGAFAMRDVVYHRGALYAVADDNLGPDVFVIEVGGPDGAQLTLNGSLALDTNNTGAVFYADKLLVSTDSAAEAVTTLDVTQSPPVVSSTTESTAGASALAVRHGLAYLATGNAAQLQVASAGLQLEPTLPWQSTVIGCLGDSNTAQGAPLCDGQSCWPFGCLVPTCTSGQPTCDIANPGSIQTDVNCSGAGDPFCPAGKGQPICLLSWCTRMQICFSANPVAVPTYCSVEGRHGAPRPWTSVNPGAGLASILSNPAHPADGPEQMASALTGGANAFVIALGSVDVPCVGAPPTYGQILDGLEVLRVQAGSAEVFYTMPPPFSEHLLSLSCSGCDVTNGIHCYNRSMLRYRNRLLHELPPERIIDFHSGVVRGGADPDFGTDGVHFDASGQNRRARAALSKLAD